MIINAKGGSRADAGSRPGLFVGFHGYFHGKEQVKYNKGTVIKDF